MSEYKKPMDLTPCAPHLIAVHFADESYTATPSQQKMLCDEMWRRWANHERLTWLLGQIIQDLPASRDWLDPEIEREARALLAALEAEKGGEL